MELKKATEQSVKNANIEFYNAIADSYEKVDGRRSPKLEAWIRDTLAELAKLSSAGTLLDIGTGSGLVTRCAEGIFKERIGLDISQKILESSRSSFDLGVCADIDRLPFTSSSFDAITCFSVLHHLYDFKGLVSEAARVTKSGGVFYSDHDMDINFNNKFGPMINIYRKSRNAASKYRKAANKITNELYKLSEWQENGIDSEHLINLFIEAGFSVKPKFHWFGLNPLSDLIFGKTNMRRGYAPLFSLVCTKL
ncbi:MAG: methyltransferase domain-containing protein [Elusimicrobiota bacterium]